MTLGYRPPLAWDALVALFRRDAIAGVEMVQGRTYARTARVDGRSGVIIAEDAKEPACLKIGVSLPLLPSLMPLLVRLRDLFDLDAEPTMVDACLEQGGLQALVRRRRGLRIPGALDAFELILRAMLIGSARPGAGTNALSRRVVAALGERIETGVPLLTHLPPGAERVAEAGPNALRQLGVPRRRAEAITAAARLLADGALRLAPGQDTIATRDALMAIDGVDDRLATTLVMRAVRWPDAFPASDGALQRAAGVPDVTSLLDRAEQWRPWRAYAALHLWMEV